MRHGEGLNGQLSPLGKKKIQSTTRQLIKEGYKPDVVLTIGENVLITQSAEVLISAFKQAGQNLVASTNSELRKPRVVAGIMQIDNDKSVVLMIGTGTDIRGTTYHLIKKEWTPGHGECLVLQGQRRGWSSVVNQGNHKSVKNFVPSLS